MDELSEPTYGDCHWDHNPLLKTTWYMSEPQFWVMMYLGGRARYSPRIKGHPRKGRNWTAIKWRKGVPPPQFVEPFRDDPFTTINAMNKRIADAFAWRSNSPALENQR